MTPDPIRRHRPNQKRRLSIERLFIRERAPETIRIVADAVLTEGWTSINPDRTFPNQRFDIRQEVKTSRLERDGRLSVSCRPMRVTWVEGKPEDLKGVTRVKLVRDGIVLIDKALIAPCEAPQEALRGVSFDLAAESPGCGWR
jgi:hypothetical protein